MNEITAIIGIAVLTFLFLATFKADNKFIIPEKEINILPNPGYAKSITSLISIVFIKGLILTTVYETIK